MFALLAYDGTMSIMEDKQTSQRQVVDSSDSTAKRPAALVRLDELTKTCSAISLEHPWIAMGKQYADIDTKKAFNAIIKHYVEWFNSIGLTVSKSLWRDSTASYVYEASMGPISILKTWRPFMETMWEHRYALISAYERFNESIEKPRAKNLLNVNVLTNILMLSTRKGWFSPSYVEIYGSGLPTADLRLATWQPDFECSEDQSPELICIKDKFWKHVDVWYPYLRMPYDRVGPFIAALLDSDLTDADINVVASTNPDDCVRLMRRFLFMRFIDFKKDIPKLVRSWLPAPESMHTILDAAISRFPYKTMTGITDGEWHDLLLYMLTEASMEEAHRFSQAIDWGMKNNSYIPRRLLDPVSIHDGLDEPFTVVWEDAIDDDLYFIAHADSIMPGLYDKAMEDSSPTLLLYYHLCVGCRDWAMRHAADSRMVYRIKWARKMIAAKPIIDAFSEDQSSIEWYECMRDMGYADIPVNSDQDSTTMEDLMQIPDAMSYQYAKIAKRWFPVMDAVIESKSMQTLSSMMMDATMRFYESDEGSIRGDYDYQRILLQLHTRLLSSSPS